MLFWYVCDGEVEEYSGQKANWDNSLVICAQTPEDALIKALLYYRGDLQRKDFPHEGKIVSAIS